MLSLFAAAAASAATLQSDLQCLAIYTYAVATAEKEADRLPATLGTMYFYGRVEQQSPTADLAVQLQGAAEQLEKMGKAPLLELGEACDKQLEAAGFRMQSAGQRMQAAASRASATD